MGGGLEGGYDTSLTGDAATLYEALFQLTADQYPKVLDMLSGEEAGELALANIQASKVLLDAVNQHLNLGSVSGGMASLPQSVNQAQGGTSDTEVWGGLFGSWTNGDDTISGPGWDGTEKGVMAGVDTMVDRNVKLGAAASYTSDGKLDFNPYGKPVGNHGSFDGFQIAGYGHYDADEGYYLQGYASYGTFNDTRRYLTLPFPFVSGVVRGSYTSDVWSLYGEGGMKWSTGGDVNLTPYLGFGYMESSSGSYIEHGLGGGSLSVSDAKATSFASYLECEARLRHGDGRRQAGPHLAGGLEARVRQQYLAGERRICGHSGLGLLDRRLGLVAGLGRCQRRSWLHVRQRHLGDAGLRRQLLVRPLDEHAHGPGQGQALGLA